jgi:hypothetical protein
MKKGQTFMGNQIYFKIAGKKKIEQRVEPPDTFLEENHPSYFYLAFSWLSMMTVFDLSGLVMMCMLVIQ